MNITDEYERREFQRVREAMKLPNAIFTFGSNTAGRHGAGAARAALENYGAEYGVGEGLTGRSYALPTKDERIETLPLPAVAEHVERFLDVARSYSAIPFVVTRVGCGLAGLQDRDVAPMFKGAPENCLLPEGWRTLNGERE